jgi:hypothetical protein
MTETFADEASAITIPSLFKEAVGELAEGQAPHSKAWEERLS